MTILQAIISIGILGLIYYFMVIREKPTPISWLQALLPIVLGGAAISISFYALFGVSALIGFLGISAKNAHPFVKSMLMAFMMAGAPEELSKLLFMIIAIFLFRKKIKNVYEYILIGAAIGIGFTLFEEFLYADESSGNLIRVLTIAGHMTYGIIMAKHIGIAKYNKINGKSRFIHYALALIIPIVLHTLYDACTGNNLMMLSEDTALQDAGVMFGLIATGVHFIIQIIVVFIIFKNADKYCGMITNVQNSEEQNTENQAA